MIKVLQEKMKLECESSLSRISNNQIQNYTKTPTERIEESVKVTYSTVAGTAVGAVSNVIGGNMGLGYGIAKAVDTHNAGNVFEGMKEFNEQYVNPVNNKIKKMVSTNDTAYDIGYIAGNFAPAVASFYMAGSTLTTVPTTLETFTSTIEAGTGVATLGKVVSVTIPIVTSEAPALTVATSTTGATSAMQIASGGLNGGNGNNENGNETNNTLTDAQKSRLNTLDNVIKHNLKETDFSGTLEDLKGNPIPNPNGGYYDHLTEMKQSYKALKKIQQGLDGSLKNPNLSNIDKKLLQEGLKKANSYIERIENLFEPFGGIK